MTKKEALFLLEKLQYQAMEEVSASSARMQKKLRRAIEKAYEDARRIVEMIGETKDEDRNNNQG